MQNNKFFIKHERIIVKKNGEESAFLTENWPMFVENILPSALSSFFFFDGEKIADMGFIVTPSLNKVLQAGKRKFAKLV